MQNIFSTLPLSDLGSLIPSLLFLGMGVATIILDLRNRRKERRQRLQLAWYQRIMMLTGVILVIIGLMIVTFTDVVTPGSPRWLYSALSIMFLFAVIILAIYAFLIIIRSTMRLSSSSQILFLGRVEAEQGVIAASPLLLITRMILIGSTFLLFATILLEVFQLITLVIQHQLFFWGWALLYVVPLLIFLLVRMSIRLRTLLRIERLRFSLTPERNNDIASVSPISESPAFCAPLSITLRIKRLHLGILAALTLGFLVPGTINLVVQFTQPDPFSGQSNIFFLIFLLIVGFMLLVLCFLPLFIARTTIEVKENGLRNESGKFLHWREARLFACYQLPDLLPGRSTVTIYELSSSSSVITWRWIHNPRSPLSIWKPLIAIDEYHRQMQILCDLVIEKTGLPLYNLAQLLEEQTASK